MIDKPLQPLVAPLFVPANRPERFAKAQASGADAIIIDLEDAVAEQHKDEARRTAATASSLPGIVLVRINGAGTPWQAGDVALLQANHPFGVMIPKAEDLEAIVGLLAAIGPRRAVLLIESARGLRDCNVLATLPGVSQLAFGPADFCRDVGCRPDSRTVDAARSAMVIASRAAGIAAPLDGPSFEVSKPEAALSASADALALGFGGKLCIHPSQPPLVHRAFAPTEEEIVWARKVISASRDTGATKVEGVMVDKPIVEAAMNTLRRAGALA